MAGARVAIWMLDRRGSAPDRARGVGQPGTGEVPAGAWRGRGTGGGCDRVGATAIIPRLDRAVSTVRARPPNPQSLPGILKCSRSPPKAGAWHGAPSSGRPLRLQWPRWRSWPRARTGPWRWRWAAVRSPWGAGSRARWRWAAVLAPPRLRWRG